MIDFSIIRAITMPDHLAVDEAHDRMRGLGVRSCFVLRDEQVIGLITAKDIEGGRTMRLLRAHRQLRRAQVRLCDIAIPCDELPGVNWDAILHARVSDLTKLFEATGYSHLLVLERGGGQAILVRGLVSRSRLQRLGLFE